MFGYKIPSELKGDFDSQRCFPKILHLLYKNSRFSKTPKTQNPPPNNCFFFFKLKEKKLEASLCGWPAWLPPAILDWAACGVSFGHQGWPKSLAAIGHPVLAVRNLLLFINIFMLCMKLLTSKHPLSSILDNLYIMIFPSALVSSISFSAIGPITGQMKRVLCCVARISLNHYGSYKILMICKGIYVSVLHRLCCIGPCFSIGLPMLYWP